MALMPLDFILNEIYRSPIPMSQFKTNLMFYDSDTAYAQGGSTWTILSTTALGEYPIVAQRHQDKVIASFTVEGKRQGYTNQKQYNLKPYMDKVVLAGRLYKNNTGWEYHAYSRDSLIESRDIRSGIEHTITVEVPRE